MLAKMLDLKQTACIQLCFDISISPFCCIHVRLISPGIMAQNRVGGSRKSWTYHTQDSPALCTWEPSPGAGVVVSARASSPLQPGSRALHFCAHLLCSPHTHPSEPLPTTLGWTGVEEKREEVDLHQLDFLPSVAQSWAAQAGPWSPGWGLPASPRGEV